MEADKAPIKLTVNYGFFKVIVLVLSVTCSVVVFAFSTFVTKSEVSAARRYDENTLLLLREDVKELRQDVKELLKKEKGK